LIDEVEGTNISSKISVLIGSLCDLQSIYFIAQFLKLNGNTDIQVGNHLPKTNNDISSFYSLNKTIDSLKELNTLILIGVQTRYEASLLNTLLRKHQLSRGITYLTIGSYAALKLKQKHLGTSIRTVLSFSENKLKENADCYLESNPSIFYGYESLKTKNGQFLERLVRFLGKKLITKTKQGERLGVIHSNISSLNYSHLGLNTGVRSSQYIDAIQDKEIATLFLVQVDDFKNEK
jgi:hypothetical protein